MPTLGGPTPAARTQGGAGFRGRPGSSVRGMSSRQGPGLNGSPARVPAGFPPPPDEAVMTSTSDPSAYHWALVLLITALVIADLGELSTRVRGAEPAQLEGTCCGYSDPLTYIPDPECDGPT